MVKRLSKAQAYENRIFCAEYDLQGMIEAYGYREVCDMIEEIMRGEIEIITKRLKARANAKRNNKGQFIKAA